ncbi:alginate lyase family protein [Taibaiella koreensis]|uniref:alginate lyase family protein n=1 Tax=Taibaiella koreensis TaxID=1268548 RepID=UPI000E59D6E1|nr:alginate lyase family protein [Taibaiella koreensis]
MNRYNWYISRLKTMSIPEIGFRTKQYVQKKKEQYSRNTPASHVDYAAVYQQALTSVAYDIPASALESLRDYHKLYFFGTELDLNGAIDWHRDPLTGKHFPRQFTKSIAATSEKYGIAKAVLEVNRLQFLVPMALQFRMTGDRGLLQRWMEIVADWANKNPYLVGINWYSNIEVNIRLVVWYYSWQILASDTSVAGDPQFRSFCERIWLPLVYQHCLHSHNNPSRYSSANNHLISEYSGLYLAATCWCFPGAEAWRSTSKAGLEAEIQRQHSADGINKEEASEYIQFITDFLLLPYLAGEQYNDPFSPGYREKLIRIICYIDQLLDREGNFLRYGDEDDGRVLWLGLEPHFNNFYSLLVAGTVLSGDGGVKARRGLQWDLKNGLLFGEKGKRLFNEAKATGALAQRSAFYKEEGHFIFRKQEGEQEILFHFDAAPLGYLSIAAHGHADALSVMLHLDGMPLLVDPGTYTYHAYPAWRKYFAGTMAHNTISVDGQDQALLAGAMMWLKHYNVTVTDGAQTEDRESASASHDGYVALGIRHTRHVSFQRDEDLFLITDSIEAEQDVLLYHPWHFHPATEITRTKDGSYTARRTGGARQLCILFDPAWQIESHKGAEAPLCGWYSPSFLVKEPGETLLASIRLNKGSYQWITQLKIQTCS